MTGLQADYYIKVLDNTTSEVLAIIDDFKSLEYELLHNDVGNHTIITREDDTRLNDLPLDTYIQVWRKYPGAEDYALEYDGFHRTPQHTITEVNRELNTSYGRALNDILKRRFLLYKAGTDQTKKSAEVDQVMYEFVEENAGPTAQTSPDRLRNIINSINVVVPDPPFGPIWTGQRSYKNLLEVLQELGTWSTWRFLVTRDYDEEFSSDPNALVFRSFEKGAERRVGFADPPTLFSPQLGNMLNPSFTVSRTDEFQAVVALGQGEGEDRIFSESLGEGVADSPYNDIEYAEDARQEELTSGLEVAALTVLQDNAPATTFQFEVLQQPSCIYGRDYALSDLVSARFSTTLLDYRVTGVHVIVSEGRENITVTFQHVPHKFNLEPGDLTLGSSLSTDPLADAFANFNARLRGLETREALSGFTLPQFTVPVVDMTGASAGSPLVWDGTKFVPASTSLNAGISEYKPNDFDLGPFVLRTNYAALAEVPLLQTLEFPQAVDGTAYIHIGLPEALNGRNGVLVLTAYGFAVNNGGTSADPAEFLAYYATVGVGQAMDFSGASWIGPFGNTTLFGDGNYRRIMGFSFSLTALPTNCSTFVKLVRKGSTDTLAESVYMTGMVARVFLFDSFN